MIVKKNLLVSKYKFQVLNNELINKNPSSALKKKKIANFTFKKLV